jgi:hypothetical protein
MTATATSHPGRTQAVVRRAGDLCLWSGLLGAASGIFLAVVEPSVPDTRFSYPLTAGAFIAIQVWFGIQHLGLIAGQVGLWASGAVGRSRTALAGHLLGLGGMGLLAATEVLATTAAESPYPSSRTDVLDILYGVSSTVIGIGLVIVGVTALRAHVWASWRRWLPLAMGMWVFVPMTPAIMAGFLPARLSITAWMLMYAALGYVLKKSRTS